MLCLTEIILSNAQVLEYKRYDESEVFFYIRPKVAFIDRFSPI